MSWQQLFSYVLICISGTGACAWVYCKLSLYNAASYSVMNVQDQKWYCPIFFFLVGQLDVASSFNAITYVTRRELVSSVFFFLFVFSKSAQANARALVHAVLRSQSEYSHAWQRNFNCIVIVFSLLKSFMTHSIFLLSSVFVLFCQFLFMHV